MKFCPDCRISYDDDANVCGQCGKSLVMLNIRPMAAPGDHTASFDPADIAANKVLAMVPYLFGWFGIIIALLAAGQSPYTSFHVRQALKIQIVSTLVTIIGAIIPILGWIVAALYALVSFIITLVSFVSVCKGEAKEPILIRNIGFLK